MRLKTIYRVIVGIKRKNVVKILYILQITIQLSVVISAFKDTLNRDTEQSNPRVDVVEHTQL